MHLNPYPDVCLWDKNYRDEWEKWLDKQFDLVQYDDLQDAMHSIMRMTKGTKVSPQAIIDVWKRRCSNQL